jgi:transcriptional regulator with XRE-family HTH domain
MGERLKRLREAAGLSQQKLADAANVHVMTLRQWEWGRRRMSLEGFLALAPALGVTLDVLAGMAEAPPADAPAPKRRKKGDS